MDYEKAYKDALNRAKNLKEMYPQDAAGYEEVFPELAESEDERIRKDIIKTISWIVPDCQYAIFLPREQKNEWLAWLEKQKDLDKMIVVTPEVWDNAINEAFENGKKEGEKQKEQKPQGVYVDCTEHPEWYGMPPKEQKPAEWSEEDEKIRQSIIKDIKWERDNTPVTVDKDIRKYDEQIDWLKSLRSRPKPSDNWRPSEEQMDRLVSIVAALRKDDCDDMADFLAEIYHGLEKL